MFANVIALIILQYMCVKQTYCIPYAYTMLYLNYTSIKLEKMHDEKSLQDFEQGGNNCLKYHLVVVWKTEHSGTRLETEFRQEATATVI